jgi:hypothetical protein
MEFINENLESIYNELYKSLDGSPFDKFEKIKDHCWSDPDLWNLDIPENEYGDISDAYESVLHDYLSKTFDDYE